MMLFLTTNFWWHVSYAHWLVILSAVLGVGGALVYVRDIFHGKSKPNLITWGLWALSPFVATGAALAARADPWSTLRIFMSGVAPSLVFCGALIAKQGYWKLSRFDYICGAFSLLAIFVWLVAGAPVLAILAAAVADLFATLPTLIKAWKFPQTETLVTYFIGLFTASIVIPAIPVWNIENAAFQTYLLLVNTTLFLVVARGYLQDHAGSMR